MDNKKDFERIEMPILAQLTVLYEIVHKAILAFPKHERYSLGEGMQSALLSSMELAVVANSSNKFEKERVLLRLNAKIEILKILVRIALNCKFIEMNMYLNIQKRLQEIGKMTQGWVKYARNTV